MNITERADGHVQIEIHGMLFLLSWEEMQQIAAWTQAQSLLHPQEKRMVPYRYGTDQLHLGDTIRYKEATPVHRDDIPLQEQGSEPYTSIIVNLASMSVQVRADGWMGREPLYEVTHNNIVSVERQTSLHPDEPSTAMPFLGAVVVNRAGDTQERGNPPCTR